MLVKIIELFGKSEAVMEKMIILGTVIVASAVFLRNVYKHLTDDSLLQEALAFVAGVWMSEIFEMVGESKKTNKFDMRMSINPKTKSIRQEFFGLNAHGKVPMLFKIHDVKFKARIICKERRIIEFVHKNLIGSDFILFTIELEDDGLIVSHGLPLAMGDIAAGTFVVNEGIALRRVRVPTRYLTPDELEIRYSAAG